MMHELLRAEIDKQKRLRGLRNADLARMTGYKANTITKFISGHESSERLAEALAKALGIER